MGEDEGENKEVPTTLTISKEIAEAKEFEAILSPGDGISHKDPFFSKMKLRFY